MKTAILAIVISFLSSTFSIEALAAKKTGLKAHTKSSLTLKQKLAKKKKVQAKRKPAALKPVLMSELKVNPNRPLTW